MLDQVDHKTLQVEGFRADVLAGLSASQKTLPSRWLYDGLGCGLFEEITRLEEYYPTRTETAILRDNSLSISEFCGSEAALIEYGAGAGIKTEILLGAMRKPDLYVPIDIAGDFVERTVDRIRGRFPSLSVRPIVADFTTDFDVSPQLNGHERRIAFFPGSTIGNLDDDATGAFLRRMRRHTGKEGRAIVGVDLKKDIATLISAYDDRDGVTARFNLNLLARINRELRGDFLLQRFVHQARWNNNASAIEMHLVSLDDQSVTVGDRGFDFACGETIHTESCRKYDVQSFAQIVNRNGWDVCKVWQDRNHLFGVFGMIAKPLPRTCAARGSMSSPVVWTIVAREGL
jgi:dimethylhistidine N-methyltransferase